VAPIYEAELYDLLKFAKAFASLGSAVQDQLDDLANERFEQVNPNALYLMEQRLYGQNEELDDVMNTLRDILDDTTV
jgi:hypothetical protein